MGLKEALELPDDSPSAQLGQIIGPAPLEIAQAQIARGAHLEYIRARSTAEGNTQEQTDKP